MSDASPRRARRIHPAVRLLRIAVVIAAVVVALRVTGLAELVRDQDRLDDLVDRAGLAGPVLFALLFTLLVPVGVPGLVFVLPAAVIFSAPVAIAVSLVGGYTSSAIGMIAARRLGRAQLEARLSPRMLAWNERISRGGVGAVIALRVITYLAAPADWLLGLTKISNRDLAIGTAIGLVPPTLAYVIGGGGLLDLVL